MPRISVVVPVYNVEPYLAACLESIARQTERDLEVIVVDDGSTDGSAAIAAAFAERDGRFTLIRQANAGLGQARNAGTDRAAGEYLAFVDSDDELEPRAYERLLGALERTGSDFASGNVVRLTAAGVAPAAFLSRAFARTRLRTHVTRQRELLADRTAWNKLWRRSFWDAHGLRFPAGVLHEDIPVVLPAHFLARSVDVLAEPVYRYRVREGGELSITQRRLERRALRDRLAAVEHVAEFIAGHGPAAAHEWYLESLLRDDLRRHLQLLEAADPGYRAEFLARAAALLDGARDGIRAGLPAIDRLKWHLVERRLLPELLEVLRFEREQLAHAPAVRVRGRWYGDYPFRTDPRLRVPRHVYRLRSELAVRAQVDALELRDATLRLGGRMHIQGLDVPWPESQRAELSLLRPGRWRAVRLRTSAVPLRTFATRRREVARPLAWSGFEAAIDVGRLTPGRWELYAHVVARGVRRRWSRFAVAPEAAVSAVAGEALVEARGTRAGRVIVDVHAEWARIAAPRLADGRVLELSGDLRAGGAPQPVLELHGAGAPLRCPVAVDGGSFTTRVPWAALRGEDGTWTLRFVADGRELPLALAVTGAWLWDGTELLLTRMESGAPALVHRTVRPVAAPPASEPAPPAFRRQPSRT